MGISIGTRTYGVARLIDHSLEDWHIKNFDGVWSDAKCSSILLSIENYIDVQNIGVVCIKVIEDCRTSEALEELKEGILSLCNRKCIRIEVFTISDLKAYYGCRNKDELVQYALKVYPELSSIYNRSKRVRKMYYLKIFEAVLLCRMQYFSP